MVSEFEALKRISDLLQRCPFLHELSRESFVKFYLDLVQRSKELDLFALGLYGLFSLSFDRQVLAKITKLVNERVEAWIPVLGAIYDESALCQPQSTLYKLQLPVWPFKKRCSNLIFRAIYVSRKFDQVMINKRLQKEFGMYCIRSGNTKELVEWLDRQGMTTQVKALKELLTQ